MPRIATREVGVALHIGADDGNERLPFQPREEPCWGLAGFDGKLLLDVGNEVVEPRPTSGPDAADLGARQPLRPLRDRYGDEVAAQLILVAAGDTNVGITPSWEHLRSLSATLSASARSPASPQLAHRDVSAVDRKRSPLPTLKPRVQQSLLARTCTSSRVALASRARRYTLLDCANTHRCPSNHHEIDDIVPFAKNGRYMRHQVSTKSLREHVNDIIGIDDDELIAQAEHVLSLILSAYNDDDFSELGVTTRKCSECTNQRYFPISQKRLAKFVR